MLANPLLAGLISFVLIIATSCLVSCAGGSSSEPSLTEVENELFKSDLPPISPEKTIELLELSHRLGSGPAFTAEWRRSWKLIQHSINELEKCNEQFFNELERLDREEFGHYNRIADYLEYCRVKQLRYCRNNFNELVAQSAAQIGSDESALIDSLLVEIAGDVDLESIALTGLQNIPTERSYSALLHFLENQNGPLNNLGALDTRNGFQNYEGVFQNSIGILCSSVQFEFRQAIFTLDATRPELNSDLSLQWMALAKVCGDIRKHSFIENSYREYLKQNAKINRLFASYGLN